MKKQNVYYIIACVILILAGLYVGGLSKEIKIPSSQPLISFPSEFKGFRGERASLSYENFHNPSADEWILRVYSKKGENIPIHVFIGYWENQDEIKKINPPRYTSGGWKYYWIKTKSLLLGSRTVNLKEFLNERGPEKELVYYCYIIDRKVVSNEYYLRFLNMLNLLLHGRNNASLLRVSMPITDEWPIEKAESYEENFIKEILPLLLEYL